MSRSHDNASEIIESLHVVPINGKGVHVDRMPREMATIHSLTRFLSNVNTLLCFSPESLGHFAVVNLEHFEGKVLKANIHTLQSFQGLPAEDVRHSNVSLCSLSLAISTSSNVYILYPTWPISFERS